MMKQMLILLLFLTGVAPLIHYKYYLIQQNKTWSDAQTFCRARHFDLATIHTDADRLRLQAGAPPQFCADVWVGVYKESHDWRWSYGNVSLGAMTKWYPGEPSSTESEEECSVMRSDGFWDDLYCKYTLPFVCYDERNTGASSYIYIVEYMIWTDAQSYCRRNHTDLASARDETQHSLITGMVPDGIAWIGLSRVTWKWLDQTYLPSITWMPGQPDNYLGKEDCGYLSNFTAADDQCSETRHFICYRVTTGQIQSLRFKVQSDQNMNDPAVNAALLEKILQKLKEHGMNQNITLKWRKQPGGDVFHKLYK